MTRSTKKGKSEGEIDKNQDIVEMRTEYNEMRTTCFYCFI